MIKAFGQCYFVALVFIATKIFSQDVDPLTGRAIINLPIGSISAYDLSVGVNLSHSGGALRLEEGPGNAGMGWNVNIGGSVVREVRGLPDDYNGSTRKGWLNNPDVSRLQSFNSTSPDVLGSCPNENADFNWISTFQNNDTEPDIYYFNAPGISGKFILGTDGLPKLIPYQDLQVTFASGSIVIKTNTGMTYTFANPESITRTTKQYKTNAITAFLTDYNFYTSSISFNYKWNLSSIQSGVTNKTVNFTYQNGEMAEAIDYKTLIQPPSTLNAATTQVDTLYTITDKVYTTDLTSVNLGSYYISIQRANALIQSITISENETGDAKQYVFNYMSVSGSVPGLYPIEKPFLKEVKQAQNCSALPSFSFVYLGVNVTTDPYGEEIALASVPWFKPWGQDYFGYYNGNYTNRNIPTIYYYANESDARRLRHRPIAGLTETLKLNGTNTNGSTMEPNLSYITTGALWSITYPTGGKTLFNYELNKYWDASVNEEVAGPGIRVNTITSIGGEAAYGKVALNNVSWHSITKTFQYTRADANTSGTIVYPPVFAFATYDNKVLRTQRDAGPGGQVLYSRVKEITSGKGYRVYEYDIPNIFPDAGATVGKIARQPGSTCTLGFLKNGLYSFPFAPVQDLDYTRGLPRKISDYTESNVLTQQKRITYTSPSNPGSNFIKGLRFEWQNFDGYPSYHFSTYSIPCNQSKITATEFTTMVGEESPSDSTRVTTAYAYNTRNMVTQSTQTTADGAVSKNFVKYALDYNITAPSASDQQANAIMNLNIGSRGSTVIETYSKITPAGGTERFGGGQINYFTSSGAQVFPSQSKQFPQMLSMPIAFAESYVSSGSNQVFTADSRYIGSTVVEYENNLPVTQTTQGIIASGTHYSTGTSIPLASFANCRADNAVYEGFEMVNARGLSFAGGAAYIAGGRTGNRSASLTSSQQLNTVTAVTKGGNSYRVSFWILAVDTATVFVKANPGTSSTPVKANYTTPNQWQYIEKTLDVTTVSSPFAIRVTASKAVQIDDFVAMPKSASVSSSTMLPLTGATSQSDNNGNSTIVNYDGLGRKSTVYDFQRNLTDVYDYKYQLDGAIKLSANFTASTLEYVAGQPVAFYPPAFCNNNVSRSFSWIFTDDLGNTSTSTSSIPTYTFNRVGSSTVKLTVSAPGYAPVSFTDQICVSPGIYGSNISIAPNSSTIYSCSATDDWIRTFSASITSLHNSYTVQYSWEATDVNGNWVQANQHPSLPQCSNNCQQLTFHCPNYTFQVRCTMTVVPTNPSSSCTTLQLTTIAVSGITFVNQGQCP